MTIAVDWAVNNETKQTQFPDHRGSNHAIVIVTMSKSYFPRHNIYVQTRQYWMGVVGAK